jgi:TRAP transporter 4TM/12TM fusion protein
MAAEQPPAELVSSGPEIGPDSPWALRVLLPVFGTALCLIAIALATELHLKLGFEIFTEQGLAAIYGLGLAIIFMKLPAGQSRARPAIPWYDAALAALSFGVGAYLAVRYPLLQDELFERRAEAFAVGVCAIPLTVEALRRTAGWNLVVILLAFLIYSLTADWLPNPLDVRTLAPFVMPGSLTIDNVGLFGLPMTIICTIVIMFILLGQLLLKSGASQWFTDIATALIGGTRGGSAKIAVIASGLFGSISGSAVSNVVSTGVITIPLMRQGGYAPNVAGAFEAVASTGGQIMPPIMGAAAFLMAEFLEISYVEVVIAAIIPSLLYYVAVFLYADLEAAKKNIAPVPKDRIPPLLRVLREGWFYTLPFALLIYALFALNRSPEEAAIWAAGSVVVVNWIFGYKGHRMRPAEIYHAIRDTGVTGVDIVAIGAMAGFIIGVVEVTGLGNGLTIVLIQFGEGNLYGLLAITAVVCIILGMGMPTTAIYLLVALLAAPPLIKLGVHPIAAHMFVLYFGIVSLITPPVAVAAFVAANLAGAKPMETAVTAVRIGWTALVVPVIFVTEPALIMQGGAVDIVLACLSAAAGVWAGTVAFMGYLTRPMTWPVRTGFLLAAIALLIPANAFPGAGWVEIAGGVLAAALVGAQSMGRRRLEADPGL